MTELAFDKLIRRLSAVSEEKFLDPGALDWPAETDPDGWYFSPELVSLYGSDIWCRMSEPEKKRLSFYEAVNFFSLNIHGEKYLISEVSRRLYQGEQSEVSRYLLHLVEEEVKHMMYFSGFCDRYAGKIYPDRTLQIESSDDEEAEIFLLLARINIFEEISDYYNIVMAKDGRLEPIAREINRIHHVEESRHLAFGRGFLKTSLERHGGDWDSERRASMKSKLSGYLDFVWKQYYNPDVYQDLGLVDTLQVRQETFESPRAQEHRHAIHVKRLTGLESLDLLVSA